MMQTVFKIGKFTVFACPLCRCTVSINEPLTVDGIFQFEKRIETHELLHGITPSSWPDKPNLRTSWGLSVIEHWSDLG